MWYASKIANPYPSRHIAVQKRSRRASGAGGSLVQHTLASSPVLLLPREKMREKFDELMTHPVATQSRSKPRRHASGGISERLTHVLRVSIAGADASDRSCPFDWL